MATMDIASGAVRVYLLFDVADTIDLARLRTIEGEGLERADLPLRPHKSSAYLQFPAPPLVARLADTELADRRCAVRVKLFDYGVISLRLSFEARGDWARIADLCESVRRDERISAYAHATVMRVCDELGGALAARHTPLVEDYLVIDVERFSPNVDAEDLLHDHSAQLAALLLGERETLARAELDESLRVRFSYHADDLTVVQWDTAFIYDRRESSDAIQDILEFANSQLLELRTYDALLDSELDVIYKMQPSRPERSLLGRREADQAATLRQMIVDVLELLDRSSNALKVVGDAYYARIYREAARRLGLADWQHQIDSKLASVRDIYRFLTDQARSRRDEFMELIVIALIALEVIIGAATLFHH